MYRSIILFISLRYLYGRSIDRFCRFISWLSTIAITLGVMSMIIVLSVMNGFEKELQNNILGLIPQVVISSVTGSINPKQLSKKTIKIHGVNYISPITTSDIVLQSSNNIAVGIMIGIDPIQKDPLTPYLINAKQNDLKPGKYNIILGDQLAIRLGVNRGDQLRMIIPSISQITPIGYLPSQRLFNVIGTFSVKSEVNNYQVLVNIQDASRLMHYPLGNITGWRLWLSEPLKVEELNRKTLPKSAKWQDWRERKGELFQAVKMEKNAMKILLSMIVIVSSFNIITSLGLMVIEKKKEIAILQTQGLLPHHIMMIFIIQGMGLGTIGVTLGTLLGIIFTSYLNEILSIFNILFSSTTFPIVIEPMQIGEIIFIVIIISLISTIYPSWHATAIYPAKTLNHE